MSISALRIVIPILFLATLYLSQRYWVRSARRAIMAVRRPRWRAVLRFLWNTTGILVLLAVAERFATFRSAGWPAPVISRWSSEFLGLWFTWSIFAFLAISLVRGMDWIGRRGASLAQISPTAHEVCDSPPDPRRRYFLRTATYAAGALPLAGTLYGFIGRFAFEVYRVDVPIPGLPHGLDGLRILQLSDIHASNYMPISQVRRIVDKAARLPADVIMVTGDLLTGRGDPLDACVAELSRLRAPLGVWGCNGNHEIYTHTQEKAAGLFRQYGMTMLRQENAQLPWRGAKFNLIGVDYQRQHWFGENGPMLEGVATLVRQDMPNILLSHNPNAFPRASELGIDLMLAGHTHGGQVEVEILDHRISPARFITPYIAGLYRRPMSRDAASLLRSTYASVYVSRGLGTIGTPLRLGVPPEITLLTLRRAS